MRVDLRVPYSEKDEAKRHGARWDAVRKTWWINRHDIATNPGVYRWIADNKVLATKARAAFDFFGAETASRKRRSHRRTPASSDRNDFSLPDCCCPAPPWEHCAHSLGASGMPPH